MTPMLGIMASQISGHLFAPSGAYDSIATVAVGAGGSSTITFSSIPSTYTHLQIRATPKVAAAVNVYYKFNSDATTTNYDYHYLYGDGTTPSTGWSSGVAVTGYIGYISQTQPSAMVMDILDYANTNKYKTTRTLLGVDANGTGNIELVSTSWMSTAAITQIDITSAQVIAQYSSFALYGVK